MNKTTRLLAAILCVFSIHQSQAQVEVTYGPELGFSAAGLYDSEENIFAGVNLQLGGTAHIQIGNHFAVRPSLLFRPGSYMSNVDFTEEKISLTRVSVPVALLYSRNFENSNKFFVGGGPNFMYSLSGKTKDGGMETDINFGDNGIKRFDLGLHLKGGFQFGMGLSLNLFFNAGLSNLAQDNDFDYTLKSLDAIGFSIGWMFGGNKDNY